MIKKTLFAIPLLLLLVEPAVAQSQFRNWLSNTLGNLTGGQIGSTDEMYLLDRDGDSGNPGSAAVTVDDLHLGRPVHGATVGMSGDFTAVNLTTLTPTAWDDEFFDIDGWHDNTTNNQRLTVPTDFDGAIVRLTAGTRITLFTADEWLIGTITEYNSSSVAQRVWATCESETGATAAGVSCTTPAHAATATNYYQFELQTEADTSVTIVDIRSAFSVEVLGR